GHRLQGPRARPDQAEHVQRRPAHPPGRRRLQAHPGGARMRRFLTLPLLGLGLLLPAPRALAQQAVRIEISATAVTSGPQTDYKDFLFLASDRPVLLRLHLRIDGQPYHAPWDEYVKKFFAYCDRDNNGSLSPKELENVPNGQFLQF